MVLNEQFRDPAGFADALCVCHSSVGLYLRVSGRHQRTRDTGQSCRGLVTPGRDSSGGSTLNTTQTHAGIYESNNVPAGCERLWYLLVILRRCSGLRGDLWRLRLCVCLHWHSGGKRPSPCGSRLLLLLTQSSAQTITQLLHRNLQTNTNHQTHKADVKTYKHN